MRLYLDGRAKAHLQNPSFRSKLEHTLAAGEVDPSTYRAIYFTGGHGTMWDFRDSPVLKRVAERIYEQGGYVSSVCHGAAGLLNLRQADGKPLIAGKRVTGFSNAEEALAGLKGEVPFFLQNELSALGADYQKAWFPFLPYAIRDGRIVTGQNPNSGKAVARELLSALRGDVTTEG